MSGHGGARPWRNRRGVRGATDMEAKQVFLPATESDMVRRLAWRDGQTQQDWLAEAVRQRLARETLG